MEHEYQSDYKRIFGGLIITILLSTLPSVVAKGVISGLLAVIDSFGTMPGLSDWLNQKYMPDAEKLVKTYKVSFSNSVKLITKFVGVLIKLIWAFAW